MPFKIKFPTIFRFPLGFLGLLIGVLALSLPSTGNSRLLTYKEWKSKRTYEAQALLAQALASSKYFIRKGQASETLERKIRWQVNMGKHNVQMAKELNANDYFVMYVAPRIRDDKRVLAEAIKYLSKSEVSEIMINYRDLIIKSQQQRNAQRNFRVGYYPVPESITQAAIANSN